MKPFTSLFVPAGLLFALILICTDTTVLAQESGDWPSFHGPDRTNKSLETGLLKGWAEEGPEMLWTVSGLGKGYSSVSIAEAFVFKASSFVRIFVSLAANSGLSVVEAAGAIL